MNNEPPQLEIHESHEAAGVRLRLRGELDFATADAVADRLARLARGHNRVLLDLDGLTFMDASGVRLVLTAARNAQNDGWAFAVTRGSPPVRRLFELVDADRHLTVEDGSP